MREADLEVADALYERWAFTGKMPVRPHATIARIRGDSARLDAFVDEARRSAGRAPVLGGRDLAIYFRDFASAELITRAAIGPGKPPASLAFSHRVLGEIEAARGRWRSAFQQLRLAYDLDEVGSRDFVAFCALMPLLDVPREDLETVRSMIGRGATPPGATAGLIAALRPQLDRYVSGLLALRLNDRDRALRLATELEQLATPPNAERVVAAWTKIIRGHAAALNGDLRGALATIEPVRGDVPSDLLASPFFTHEHARFLRGELLLRLGQYEEALSWFTHSFAGTPGELLFMAPATLRRAEIYERLGQRDDAVREYGAFLELWSDADPPYQPLVSGARERLKALLAETPTE